MKKENIENKNEQEDNTITQVKEFKEELIKDEQKIKELILREILGKAKKLTLSIDKEIFTNKRNNLETNNTNNNINKMIEYYNLIIGKIQNKNEDINLNKVTEETTKIHEGNNTQESAKIQLQDDNGIQLFFELFLRQNRSNLTQDGINLFNSIIEKYGIDKNQLLLKEVIQKYVNNNKWQFHKIKNELPFYKDGNNLCFNRIGSEDNVLIHDMFVSEWLVYTLNQDYIINNGENQLNIEGILKDEFWAHFEENANLKISHALEILSKNKSVEITQTDLKVHLVNYLKNYFVSEYDSPEGKKVLKRFANHKEKWEKIFAEKGLPSYCSFLAITESRADPSRTSSQGAGGYFGFMPQTAKKYNLKIGKGIDERKDPIKSAQAAAQLISEEKQYRYNHIIYNNFKEKITNIEEYAIQDGDNIPQIASKYNTNGEIIIDFNPGIIHNKLKIGDIIKIPVKYNITDNEISKADSDSFFLGLASYNGFIAKQLDIKNYDEYLEKMSKLISIINGNKSKLEEITNKLKKGITENEYHNALDYSINLYTNLTSIYSGKFKDSIFQNRLNSLQKIKKSKKINRNGLLGILVQGKNLEIVNRYNNIVLQNLIYPSNLIASRDAYYDVTFKNSNKI